MESGTSKTLKVAWVCHFSNAEVREKLPLTKRRKYADFAPWITTMIREFEKVDGIELHIISPHRGLKKLTYRFEQDHIKYYFYKPDLPIIHKRWPVYFPVDAWTGFYHNKYLVRRFIREISPDLVNLHGAENDYYSATILGIKKIPVYVCIQGIYSNPERFNRHIRPNKSKIKIERTIHRECRYFGIFPPFFGDLIKRDNPYPILFRQSYIPDTNVTGFEGIRKKYDFVFFGRITDVKGVDKIIEALAWIQRQGRESSLIIIGPGNHDYLEYLKDVIRSNSLEGKVTFCGHLPTLQEVHKKALEAKVTVISSKFENLPGTIIESVLMNQPVTATAVGGIPYLNKDQETILLSDYGDIEGLAGNMLKLLDDPEYARRLTEKCRQFILSEFDGPGIVKRYIRQYQAIIDHYYNHTAIPEDLLFDEKHFKKS